jgi:hypothetical protein
MSDDSTAKFDIVEEHGSFLLIRAGSCFAVVERRAGRIYPMMPGGREGEPNHGRRDGERHGRAGLASRARSAPALHGTQRAGQSSRPRPSVISRRR